MMNVKWMRSLCAVVVAVGLLGGGGSAVAAEKKKKGGKAATEMDVIQGLEQMISRGRAIVSENQDLLNDKDKGDKGFTADFFVAELTKKMNEEDHVDLSKLAGKTDAASKAMSGLLAAMRKVLTDAQPILNQKGMGFKGFIPAVFARRSLEEFGQSSPIKGKVTTGPAPSRVCRNAKNAPDEWEKAQLEKFMKADYPKGKPYSETVTTDAGGKALRYIKPEYYTGKCLKCHGEPKGEKDITGGVKEGYHDGDAGAALSFVIPVK